MMAPVKKWNIAATKIYQKGQIIGMLGTVTQVPCPVSWCTQPAREVTWKDGEKGTICTGNLNDRPDGEYDLIDGIGE